MTPEEKVAWLKATDFQTFMNLLSRANGKLRNTEKIQRWTGKAAKSVVSGLSLEMEPPDDAEQDFDEFYAQMQKEISPENLKQWAAKLYIAIVFSHVFHNGNGRTARQTYALLTRSGLPSSNLTLERGKEINQLCANLNSQAIIDVCKKHGIPENEVSNHYLTADGMSTDMTDHLKYLAAKEMLEDGGVHVDSKTIEFTSLTENQRRAFDKHYSALRHEWYQEALRAVGTFQDYVIQQLDAAIDVKNEEV